MAKRMIEVERRFVIPHNFKDTLLRLGAAFKGVKEFTDIYYDTKDNRLYCNDMWLRKRDETWELKYPPKEKTATKASVQYCETANISCIIDTISPILTKVLFEQSDCCLKQSDRSMDTCDDGKYHVTNSTQANVTIHDLESLLKDFNCKPFVTYHTKRTKYEHSGMTIDLDTADFGYEVGEIEKLVSSETEVEEALRVIDSFFQTIGTVS